MFTASIADTMAYQRAYEAFRAVAETGFPGTPGYTRNLRSVDVLTAVTLVTTTDQGTNKQKTWWSPPAALADDPTKVSKPPTFNSDGKIPTESYFGLFGVALLVPVQYGTVTQLNSMLAGVGSSRHTLSIASETILDWNASRFIAAYESGWQLSTDNAATPLVARQGFVPTKICPLPSVKNLSPGAQITGQMTYTIATIAVDMNVVLLCHCFAGDIKSA